jgi:hypothetical protein
MSQNDQDRDQQDEALREGRGDPSSDSEQVNRGTEREDRSSDAGEADDMDEDRDDDLRSDGSFDRRNNIG